MLNKNETNVEMFIFESVNIFSSALFIVQYPAFQCCFPSGYCCFTVFRKGMSILYVVDVLYGEQGTFVVGV